MAVPPVVVMAPTVCTPALEVTLTAPPLPLAPPVVVKAAALTVLPVRVIEPTVPPAPVPVAPPVCALIAAVPSVPAPVIETTPALPPA